MGGGQGWSVGEGGKGGAKGVGVWGRGVSGSGVWGVGVEAGVGVG